MGLDSINAAEHPIAALRVIAEHLGRANVVTPYLVYALGQLGVEHATYASEDFFLRAMGPRASHSIEALLEYLSDHPEARENVIWTLNLERCPIYAIRPVGSFASEQNDALWEFLNDEVTEGVERISLPGTVRSMTRLRSGQVLPAVDPAEHGLYSWTTEALARHVADDDASLVRGTSEFLSRVYHQLQNVGRTSRERTINYAATNVTQAGSALSDAISIGMALDHVEAEPSRICRADSDCWDVVLTFLDPAERYYRARKMYRFTVDVSDVVPVPIGAVRSWHVATSESER
jgi:cyanobactin maturation PatA/PatG family protease